MILAIFGWKKFSCASLQGLVSLGVYQQFSSFFFVLFSTIFLTRATDFAKKKGLLVVYCPFPLFENFKC